MGGLQLIGRTKDGMNGNVPTADVYDCHLTPHCDVSWYCKLHGAHFAG